MWCAFLHADPDLRRPRIGSRSPRINGAVPGRRLSARWRTRPDIRVVSAGRS
ncbi:hypothetical protein STAFG_1286 [Streptomyces afghaniensis 772]|uniref:Uncharacterized protein n=1 Tax=Streptomyces afghaniensis 772 TaxID=1283301 RepID=S4MXC0_9ACTN|nr:hypothetical protein STAFG_1286 [Streptomyces afghaniensis 772]